MSLIPQHTNASFFKGKLTGIFLPKENSHSGEFHFYAIRWSYLKITDIEVLESVDVRDLKVGDFWHAKALKAKKKWLPYQVDFPRIMKRPEIFIPRGEVDFYSGTLLNVYIRNFDLSKLKKRSFEPWIEVTADIYFQIEKPKPPLVPTPIHNVNENSVLVPVAENVVVDPVVTPISEKVEHISATVLPGDTTTDVKKKRPGCGLLFSLFFWGLIISTLFKSGCVYLIPAILIGLAYFIFRRFRSSCLPMLFALIIFVIGGLIALHYIPNQARQVKTQQTRDGEVKISPPKKMRKDGSEAIDFTSEKHIRWWDFFKSSYKADYTTSNNSFFASNELHRRIASTTTAQNSIGFYTELYRGLDRMDGHKIDSIVKIFRNYAGRKHLSAIRTAEMVTTFVQEIPYYLVHDLSCQEAIEQSNSQFLTDYHAEGKPCLANIPGGVQSPYEFMHNLKGDCDTRSLLAFTILKKMGISASVWVSESYGHSILGVGLPVGTGVYKIVNGVKHYPIELTSKGFRLGMISPDHTDMDNWNITVYYNKF